MTFSAPSPNTPDIIQSDSATLSDAITRNQDIPSSRLYTTSSVMSTATARAAFPANPSESAPELNLLQPKPILDKKSLEYVIRSGIAGGLAGCAAKTLIAPLDRVKILFQTSNPEFQKYAGSWLGFYRAIKQIKSTQGVSGLFQGHSATILRIFPYAAIKFMAYEEVRAVIIPTPEKETSVRRFLAGSISGITSVFFTYPLDLIRVRLAFETKQNFRLDPAIQPHQHHYDYRGGRLIQTCKQIYKESPSSKSGIFPIKGITNFYRGFTPTIVGMIPYAGVSFWAHDLFHDIFRSQYLAPYAVMDFIEPDELAPPSSTDRSRRKPLTVWAQLTAGGLAGMCSQTASYPLEVIRRRIQVSGVTGERSGMIRTIRTIFAQSGIRGFFVGLSIGYIKVTPMFACSFFVYERLKLALGI